MSEHPLRRMLDAAAVGRFPAADGLVEVVAAPDGLADVIVGVTGHFLLAADIDPAEVAARMPAGDLSVPMSSSALAWLAARLDSTPATFDALLCHLGTGAGIPPWLHEVRPRSSAGRARVALSRGHARVRCRRRCSGTRRGPRRV